VIGRDRDVVDVLVMHGWFAKGGMPNDSDRRISRLLQDDRGLTGLYRTQRASDHILGEARTGVVALVSMQSSRQTTCFTGRIPTELGQLTSLTSLDLDRNNLTGACDYNWLDCNWKTSLPLGHSSVLHRSHPNRAGAADCTHTTRLELQRADG